jgi:outer membrane protein OmpA-like peptidoglycan-associated protein
MKRISFLLVAALLCILVIPSTRAQNINIDEIEKLYDSTRSVEAYVFAPVAYQKAEKFYQDLKAAMSRGQKQKKIAGLAGDFREFAENAIKTTEVTRLSLSEYLDPRDKAKAAQAEKLVPDLYTKAENEFIKATKKAENGDIKGGLKLVERSVPLFQTAELEAIKVEILGKASELIARAEADDAARYAPSTLDKARSGYEKCIAILTNDRYERDESLKSAAMAEYEASHASNIAQSVRSLERNDQAWERLMLLYEIEMQKVGTQLGLVPLPFDNGPLGAAEAMVNEIRNLQGEREALVKGQHEAMLNIRHALSAIGIESEETDPAALSGLLATSVDELTEDMSEYSEKLSNLQSSHKKVAMELEARQAAEAKIDSVRSMLKPTEGQVLLNATDDIVVRLFGLSFASGSDEITEEHTPLLDKVAEILGMFSDNKLMVEGHTDDRGERTTNMRLSEKRAFSVMQYLRSVLTISADRISAVGYGPDKPIGTNTTKEGRAKNRRIDILIFQ